MAIFGHIAKMGTKVTGGVLKGLRLGEKVTGEVARIGHKVRDYGKMAVRHSPECSGVISSEHSNAPARGITPCPPP